MDGTLGLSLDSDNLFDELLKAIQGISSAFGLILGVFMILCTAKLFIKAGEKGWKAIIPFYNSYLTFKLCWKGKKFWAAFFLTFFLIITLGVLTFCVILLQYEDALAFDYNSFAIIAIIASAVIIVLSIWLLILQIKLNVRMAKAYGQEGAFAVGLIFLPVIFLAILAFNHDEYIGPQP